ncbi:NHL repeat-containing protein [Kutzneria albida]|uniref:NHL repeat containing protein n=1 Tax=Kutzneria albida DSM 43870 TaxID=1449976 RepID=W5W4A9_9PSEU|nr:NHL repeat-containing protein [Kutzneria albida]AHH95672.1 hypothetical protein KALB_2303 [Kutzneria albida DSM 43870]
MPSTGTLTVSSTAVEQGEQLMFGYSTQQEKVSAKNWVGLYADPGNGPINGSYVGPSTAYRYSPGASGTVFLPSGALSPGNYIAFYLYDDGYTSLAEPVRFTVRPGAPLVEQPQRRGSMASPGRGLGQLARPEGLAVDRLGQLWVADTGNNRVQAFTANGLPVRLLSGRLAEPQDVAVDDAGTVYVADTGNNRVAVFAWWGGYLREFGVGVLDKPRGIAVDKSGHVYVADTRNQRVARFDARSGQLLGSITAQMSSPQGVTVDAKGQLWVVQNGKADSGNDSVVRYAADGTVAAVFGYGQHSKYGGLSNPAYVAVDGGGTVLVTVPDYDWVAQFAPTGPFRCEFGTDLRFPLGVALDRRGHIFVVDNGNSRIVEFGAHR